MSNLPMAINPSIEHEIHSFLNCFNFIDTEKQLASAHTIFLHLGYTLESAQNTLSTPLVKQFTRNNNFKSKEHYFISIPQIGELIINAPETKYVSDIINFVKNTLIPLFNKKHDDFKKETIVSTNLSTENKSQKFHSDLFGDLTVLTHDDGSLWFIGKEVAEKLGYEDPSKMYARIDEDDKKTLKRAERQNGGLLDSLGFDTNVHSIILINESGLYVAVLGSKKPEAKEFKRWVTKDILPSIRKTGSYGQPAALPNFADPAEAAIAWAVEYKEKQTLQLELKAKEEQIESDKSHTKLGKMMTMAEATILVGEYAIMLQNDHKIKIGQNRLFEWLRENGYLCKDEKNKNRPTQKSMELGLFAWTERIITTNHGEEIISFTPRLTGKGQVYFIDKLVNDFSPNAA